VDIPNIDCGLFADPKRSTIDIVQAVGRALRPAEGKQLGYVVVPVLLDSHVLSIETKRTAFDAVLIVLRALASNDERIVEYFRTVSQGRRWTGGRIPFSVDIPDGLVIDAASFVNSVEIRLWSRLAKLSWRPFSEAREFVRKLCLKNQSEWSKYCQGKLPGRDALPNDIPADPRKAYKDQGWTSMGDWLGTGAIASHIRIYRPFQEARAFVHRLKLKSRSEWGKYCKGRSPEKGILPEDIPANPNQTYLSKGWISMGDWLGTGFIAPRFRTYRSFGEARIFVRGLGLRNKSDWEKYSKGHLHEIGRLPDDIPGNPPTVYKNAGWIDWGDWLGTGRIATFRRKFRPFKEARALVHSLELKSNREWLK